MISATVEERLADAIIGNNIEYLCVEANPPGLGIENGDRCVKMEGYYLPLIRWFSENGKEKPFNKMKIEDCENFKFVEMPKK